ncbi:hypothetical protein [Sneathiella litorea]|uniref:Uncharacterized protein n=1 Tax=Sneathiella litorea TaxID=2606216 RepID=A0A6L8W6V6_9PROT|nr:hypothetical protein [Sneathiella litorea]MZR30253.1 hypothetical protein [Sneathiella litorea]
MFREDVGRDILFGGDESDTLFISAVEQDPETIELIKNFPHMLGDEEEIFAVDAVAYNADPVDADIPVDLDEDTFDPDLVLAKVDLHAEDFPLPQSIENMVMEPAAGRVDLDQLFDIMQVKPHAGYTEIDGYETSGYLSDDKGAPAEGRLDSSDLPMVALDALSSNAGIDDIFGKLVYSDES